MHTLHTKGLLWIYKDNGENQRARGLETWEEDWEAAILMKRGAESCLFENLIKGMDHSLSRKSTFLCVWCTPTFCNVRGLKDPCNLSAELLGIHRPQPQIKDKHGPESMFLTTK